MNSIMWVQSESAGGGDHIFVDGNLIPEEEYEIRATAMRILLNAQEKKYVNKQINERLRAESGSPNFTLTYCPTMGLLFKSLFNEIAFDGRGYSFALWCSTSIKDDCWDIATANAEQLGLTLKQKEGHIVKQYLESQKKKYFGIGLVGCLFLMGLVFEILYKVFAYVEQ